MRVKKNKNSNTMSVYNASVKELEELVLSIAEKMKQRVEFCEETKEYIILTELNNEYKRESDKGPIKSTRRKDNRNAVDTKEMQQSINNPRM